MKAIFDFNAMQGIHFCKRKHKFECEVEVGDSNLSLWVRTPNIVANIEKKYLKTCQKKQTKEEAWKGVR